VNAVLKLHENDPIRDRLAAIEERMESMAATLLRLTEAIEKTTPGREPTVNLDALAAYYVVQVGTSATAVARRMIADGYSTGVAERTLAARLSRRPAFKSACRNAVSRGLIGKRRGIVTSDGNGAFDVDGIVD
jgi:hypothetical protein